MEVLSSLPSFSSSEVLEVEDSAVLLAVVDDVSPLVDEALFPDEEDALSEDEDDEPLPFLSPL